MTSQTETFEGGCTCRHMRYRLASRPLFVNCCHCRWCQRDSGTAFAINAMIEADRVEQLGGEVEVIDTPSLERQGPEDLALPQVPHCGVEQLFRRRTDRALRAGRHARRARPAAARQSISSP